MNYVNITISEDDYKTLLINNSFSDMKKTVKILPDDSELLEDENYKKLAKAYKKAREEKEKYVFEKTTNK